MIQYALKCDKGHGFDSWFKSAAAFDALQDAGHLVCAECGSEQISKAVMAPRVTTSPSGRGDLSKPKTEAEKALAVLRAHVEANADYVGGTFAAEARAMYLGTKPERAIYGEASGAEAKSLFEDGIPVAPLPFLPNRKSN